MRFFSPFLSLLLTPLMAVLPLSAQIPAAIPVTPSSTAPEPAELHLKVIGNEGATALAGSHFASGFVVLVTDSSGAGLPDVAVAFRLPDAGATGVFSDGTHAAVAYTDAAGRAHSAPVDWGVASGPVSVRITAAKGTLHAGLLFDETLTAAIRQPAAKTPATPAAAVPPPSPAPVSVQVSAPPSPTIARPAVLNREEAPEPSVSVVNHTNPEHTHSGKAKWLIIAGVVAASAGLGIVMASKSKSGSSSSSSSSGVSIGTPSISVGQP